MVTDQLHRRHARRFALTIATSLALLGVSAATASASADTEQQGARLLQSIEAGKQQCEQLSRDEFAAIGEHVMGRMLGSASMHDAMDEQMRNTTGESGETQAHVFMGQRFSGCASGEAPAAFGSMMGMMGNYSGTNGGGMGNRGDNSNGFGPGMMGGSDARGDGWNGASTMLVILLLVMAVGLAVWRPWRKASPRTPLELLKDRYARGDIDTADYELRRHELGGLA